MRIEEKIYLKTLTGMVLGGITLKNYQKIAVIGMEHILSSAASAAMEASFLLTTNGNARHFVAKKGEIKEMVGDIAEYDPEIAVMLFAESPEPGLNRELFLETIKQMAEISLDSDLLFEPVSLENGTLAEAVKESEVARHLMEIESFVFTLDLEKGELVINVIDIENGELMVDPIEEYKLTVEHANLLNRAMRGKTLKWVEEGE